MAGDCKKEVSKMGDNRILVIDSDRVTSDWLKSLFSSHGYDIETSYGGMEGIFKIESGGFDLVILDLTVPGGMGGAKAIPELLKTDPNVKAVVSSGYSNDRIMANYEDYGFCGVAPKPYTKKQLSEVLNKILG